MLFRSTFGYGNLRDYGLADKKTAIEQLAARYPWIDIERVGMWGHSGGGFMTAAALVARAEAAELMARCGFATLGLR